MGLVLQFKFSLLGSDRPGMQCPYRQYLMLFTTARIYVKASQELMMMCVPVGRRPSRRCFGVWEDNGSAVILWTRSKAWPTDLHREIDRRTEMVKG